MKNQKYRLPSSFLLVAFVFAIFLSTAQETAAQRYLTEMKSTTELKGMGQFSSDLAEFLKILDAIENEKSPSPLNIKKLELAGRKVKNGANGFRNNLKGLISKLKSQNQWDENLDKEINDLLNKRNVKGLFQQNDGRKLLSEGETQASSISTDVDKIINNIKKSESLNLSENGLLTKTFRVGEKIWIKMSSAWSWNSCFRYCRCGRSC